MKILKKFMALTLVCALISSLCTPAFAANTAGVTYTAELEQSTLNVSSDEQTVVMTVKTSNTILVDGVGMTVLIPEGWEIAAIENETLGFTSSNVNLANGMVNYYTPDAENWETQLLAKVTYTVPAGAAVGTYELGIKDLVLSADYGNVWEEGGTVSVSLAIEEEQKNITYSAQLDQTTLNESSSDQTVVMTVKTSETIAVDGVGMTVVIPDGWSLAAIENETLGFTSSNVNLENGMVNYYTPDAENWETQLLAKVTYTVPANTPAGTYELGIKDLVLSADYGTVWEEDATASASLVIEEAEAVSSYTAELDKATLNESSSDQTVVMTVMASETIAVDGVGMTVVIPDGWSLAAIENETLGFTSSNVNLENGMVNYYTPDAENWETQLLAKVTYTVPANTPAGTYELGIKDLVLSADYGTVWEEDATANASLVIEEAEATSPYTAELDQTTLNVSSNAQTVVMTVKTSETIAVDGVGMTVVIPDGWSLAAIENETLGFTSSNVNLENGMVNYYTPDAENWETQLLAKVTYTVPANAPTGTYELGIKDLVLSADYGNVWEEGATASAALVIEEAEAVSSYTAELDKATLNESSGDQTVVMTVKTSETIAVDGVGMTVVIPDGWSLASIENETLGFTSSNVNLENGKVNYVTTDAENWETQLLAKVTYTVPANAPIGTYELGIKDLVLSADYGNVWEEGGTASASLAIVHVHNFVAGTYTWSDDNTSCTVIGTCTCRETATATATVISEQTKAPACEEKGETTYTASFTEAWATAQTKVVADLDATGHTEVVDAAVAPTCTETGLSEGKHCSVCNKTLIAQNVVDALGHTYVGAVCTVCGEVDPAAVVTVTTIGTIVYDVSYSTSGAAVAVTHDKVCKVGYLVDGSYVKLDGTKNEDGSYSYAVPSGVTSVLVVMTGDVNGDSKINTGDASRLRAALLGKVTLSAEAQFAADVNHDVKFNNGDYSRLNAVVLGKASFTW